MIHVAAQPYSFSFEIDSTALLIIDMQRDFVAPGGFGASLGNDVQRLRTAVEPTRRVLAAAREVGMPVLHTREGHRPDLADLFAAKKHRARSELGIGEHGPMGRILVRGEHGHAIIDELAPAAGEPVVDKPGKGAFYATDLDTLLHASGVSRLIVAGVTTEVCVSTTVREANDRGYECLVLSDCTASYSPTFHETALAILTAQDGLFGWVTSSEPLLQTLQLRGGRGSSGSWENPLGTADKAVMRVSSSPHVELMAPSAKRSLMLHERLEPIYDAVVDRNQGEKIGRAHV